MIYLNKKARWFYLIMTITGAMISLSGCKDEKKIEPFKSDESIIINFLNNNKNSTDDYYGSSSYKPSDVLYEPVLAIQRKRWDIALPLLENLVKDNDPDAMYWLASISGGSALSGVKMAALFEKSANLGNPYAALRLNIGAKDCDLYLKGYCDKKWGEKAKKILLDRELKGDVKAEYQLAILNGKEYKDTLDLSLKNAEINYFFPLYNYLYYTENIDSLTKKKVYDFMVKKMFAPVGRLMFLNYIIDSLGAEYYNGQMSKMETTDMVWHSIYNINSRLFEDKPEKIFLINKLRAKFVLDVLKNSGEMFSGFSEYNIKSSSLADYFNVELEEKGLPTITAAEVSALKSNALSIVKNIKPIVFIDQFYFDPNTF